MQYTLLRMTERLPLIERIESRNGIHTRWRQPILLALAAAADMRLGCIDSYKIDSYKITG